MRERQEPICAAIRAEIARKRFKIKDVAREVGVSPKRVERMIHNSVRLDFLTTMRIAEVLDLNPVELYRLAQEANKHED